jgi:hypothetical protein
MYIYIYILPPVYIYTDSELSTYLWIIVLTQIHVTGREVFNGNKSMLDNSYCKIDVHSKGSQGQHSPHYTA